MSEFTKRKLYSTTQHLAKIYTKSEFFQDKPIDEALIDEHIDIFRDLGAILENSLKLIFAIQHNYTKKEDIKDIENTTFYKVCLTLFLLLAIVLGKINLMVGFQNKIFP
jgi:hypothetical protein